MNSNDDDDDNEIGQPNDENGTNDTDMVQIHSTKKSLCKKERPPLQESSAKKYQCNDCNYSTDKSSNFKRHLLVHTGEQPFNCKFCAQRFNQKSNLTEHTRRLHKNTAKQDK